MPPLQDAAGCAKALERQRAHEARRRAAWVDPGPSHEELAWVEAHPIAAVRALNQVDRAVANYRRVVRDAA